MKSKIYYAQEARQDLDDIDDIWDYIALELANMSVASNTVDKIMDMIDRLASFLEIGSPLFSIADTESDYRFAVSGNYLIFYRASESDVYIDRVLYGRRDYLNVLLNKKHEAKIME